MKQEKMLLRPIRRSPAIIQREIRMIEARMREVATDKERNRYRQWLDSLRKELEDA